MTSRTLILTAGATAALGFAGGWWAKPSSDPRREAGKAAREARTLPPGSAPSGGDAAATGVAQPKWTAQTSVNEVLSGMRGKTTLQSSVLAAQFASSLTQDEARRWLTELAATPRGESYTWVLSTMIAERWAESDPEGLLVFAKENGNSSMVASWVGAQAAFRELAQRDPTAAWERARDLGGNMSYSGSQAVLTAIADKDPALALKLASESKTRDSNWSLNDIMANWANRDPKEAAAAALALTDPQKRQNALPSVALAWAAQDFPAAMAWAKGLAGSDERAAAMSSAIRGLAARDPKAALEEWKSAPLGGERTNLLADVLRGVASRDFDSARSAIAALQRPEDRLAGWRALVNEADATRRQELLAMATRLPPAESRVIYESSAGWLASRDPDTALKMISDIPQASTRETVLNQLTQGWWSQPTEVMTKAFSMLQPSSQTPEAASQIARRLADADPQGAWDWSLKLTTPAQQKSALSQTLTRMALTDPDRAASLLNQIADPAMRSELTASLAGGWSRNDPEKARQWASALDGDQRTAALRSLVQSTAGTDPAQAQRIFSDFASSLDETAASQADNKKAAASLASALAREGSAKAIEWMQQLPQGPLRDEAAGGVAAEWARYDPVAASEWAATLPAGGGRDAAAEKIVSTIARDDPEAAFTWAVSIGDAARRREAAAAALAGWKDNGGTEKARQALMGAAFSEADRTELLKKLQ